jgi:hypothetical protein
MVSKPSNTKKRKDATSASSSSAREQHVDSLALRKSRRLRMLPYLVVQLSIA